MAAREHAVVVHGAQGGAEEEPRLRGGLWWRCVQVSSLQENRAQLLDYMELDISVLGDVMLRAKSIYWTLVDPRDPFVTASRLN